MLPEGIVKGHSNGDTCLKIVFSDIPEDLRARGIRREDTDAASLLEQAGSAQAISQGLPAIAGKIRQSAADQENQYLLFTQFKKEAFGDSPDIYWRGKSISWSIDTNLPELASDHRIDVSLLYGLVSGYVKEIFEELFDSFLDVKISEQASQSPISVTISLFDSAGLWMQTVLLGLEKLDPDQGAAILEQSGRACGRSHNLAEQSNRIRAEVEDKNDIDRLFTLYKEKVYNNSPRLYREDGVIYLEYHACGCPIVKDKAITDPVFCNCTVGYTKERFESLFGRPVRVVLLESILRGNGRCRQAITIIDRE
jgi:hypothetical protein